MSRMNHLAGLSGPEHNGGVLAGLATYRLAEEDAARRAYLDVAAQLPTASRQGCPECGSGGRHKSGCSQHRTSRVLPRSAPVRPEHRCTGPDCDRRAGDAGLCSQHLQQRRRGTMLTRIRPYARRGPR